MIIRNNIQQANYIVASGRIASINRDENSNETCLRLAVSQYGSEIIISFYAKDEILIPGGVGETVQVEGKITSESHAVEGGRYVSSQRCELKRIKLQKTLIEQAFGVPGTRMPASEFNAYFLGNLTRVSKTKADRWYRISLSAKMPGSIDNVSLSYHITGESWVIRPEQLALYNLYAVYAGIHATERDGKIYENFVVKDIVKVEETHRKNKKK